MGKVIFLMNVSLDGYIESPDHSLDWTINDDELLAWFNERTRSFVLLHALYERIVVTGRTIVSIRLTPSAYAHGLAVALPDKGALARPTVSGVTT